MLGKLHETLLEAYTSQLHSQSRLIGGEELVEILLVYLDVVHGRQLRDAVDCSAQPELHCTQTVKKCRLLTLHSTQGLLCVHSGSNKDHAAGSLKYGVVERIWKEQYSIAMRLLEWL